MKMNGLNEKIDKWKNRWMKKKNGMIEDERRWRMGWLKMNGMKKNEEECEEVG